MNKWRVGSKVPINVYDGDRPVCQCQTAVDARLIVAAVNAALADDPPSLEPKPNGCLARNTYGQACYGRRQHKDPCVFGGPVNVSPAADALREAFTRDATALIKDADNR